jgi:hypothetical protein
MKILKILKSFKNFLQNQTFKYKELTAFELNISNKVVAIVQLVLSHLKLFAKAIPKAFLIKK